MNDEFEKKMNDYGNDLIKLYPKDKDEILYNIYMSCKYDELSNDNDFDETRFVDDLDNKPRKKRLNKYERQEKYKRKLKKLSKLNNFPCAAYEIYEEYVKNEGYVKLKKPYYKRYYKSERSNSAYSFHKKMSNKQVRKYKGNMPKGNFYKKIYDLWWNFI